jgi:chlorite dismutase
MGSPILVTFVGGASGRWSVERIAHVRGEDLPKVRRLDMVEADAPLIEGSPVWVLRGATGHERYVNRVEHQALLERQAPLGRPQANRAALIPIRKSAAWWDLAQDERRAIFEERSRHIRMSLEYLPRIARRLHHCRELGEPFDFLTWFEFAAADAAAFEELVARLRETEEWRYVEREVDIRLAAD